MKTPLTFALICAGLLAGLAAVPGPSPAGDSHAPSTTDPVVGYLYTSLNGEEMNQVVSFARYADGTLGEQRTYTTGSSGGANRAAGGDAAGDFDSQGAMQIIDDHLLVVNAGGNTITVFEIDKDSGSLTKKENVSSHGVRPVSIAYVPKGASSDDYWVVIGNQWNNPNVQKGGAAEAPIEMYPNTAFHADGGGHEEVLDERNIYLFSFSSRTGTLTPEMSLDSYTGTNGGPTTVAFNNDGTKLAVATWGIAHFGTATPTHQKPSRVYVYDFDGTMGRVSNTRYFEEAGIAGSIGFSWDTRTSQLFVSNFNLVEDKRDHSLTVLSDDGSDVTKIAHFGTGDGDDIDEACWALLSPDGNNLYVSSFGGNLISEFDVDAWGNVSKVGSRSETAYALRKAGTPPGDTKDMYVTGDNAHLYVLGAYQTFTVSHYAVSATGALSLSTEFQVQAATATGPGAYNFLGLVGYDR